MSEQMPEPILPPEGLHPEDRELAQRAYRMAKGINALRQDMVDEESAAAQKLTEGHAMNQAGTQLLQTLETDMVAAGHTNALGTNGHQDRQQELGQKRATSYQ